MKKYILSLAIPVLALMTGSCSKDTEDTTWITYYPQMTLKGFGTDITMNSRRGYSQSEMNDNVLLWNAWASYSMLKGALLFRLKANDILAQTKGISYSINAQGRTETRYQTLPRYVSLTVEYKFDFRPKREKQQNK